MTELQIGTDSREAQHIELAFKEHIMKFKQRILSYFKRDKSKKIDIPRPGVFYSGNRDDYAVGSYYPLDPEVLGAKMQLADKGDTQALYDIFEIVERDGHVASVWGKRRLAVTSKPLQILPADDSPRAAQAADLCKQLIGDIKNWKQSLRDMTDAIGKAFALLQIVWKLEDGIWAPKQLLRWPQRETRLGDPLTWYAQDQDDVRVITADKLFEGEPLQQYQWILHIQKAWSQPLGRAALFRAITWYFLFKNLTWKGWLIFNERYGNPLRLGKFGQGAGDDDKTKLKTALINLGIDSYAMIPDRSTIEIIESAKGQSELPQPILINHCNAEISKVMLGNPMTTEPGAKGARSLGDVYAAGELEQTEDDCLNLAATIKKQLCEPIVRFNLGDEYPVPLVSFLVQKAGNLLQRAQLDDILINNIKLPVTKRYLYQTYGIPVPTKDEELVDGAEDVTRDEY